MLAVGCASDGPPWLSPVTQNPTQFVAPGKFVWVDLLTQDPARAKSFYADLFGWTFNGTDDYVEVLQNGSPIAGIVTLDPGENRVRESTWVSNLSVTDVDRVIAMATSRGARVITGPMNAPDRGRLALIQDPAGATVLLLRSSGGDPLDGEPPLARWLWRELWTPDVESAVEFYSAVVGYESETVDFAGQPYRVLTRDDVPRAAVVGAPEEVSPQWLPYVRVADAAKTAARAEVLGARVVMRDDDAAILVDPTGAPIGIQVWAGADEEGAP